MNTTAIGLEAELVAREFLERRGMQLIAANARTRFYELDLIMRDGADIVAVEVKYRKNTDFGGGEAAISLNKRWRLKQAIEQWMIQNGYNSRDQNVRIDAVVVMGENFDCTYYPSVVEDG